MYDTAHVLAADQHHSAQFKCYRDRVKTMDLVLRPRGRCQLHVLICSTIPPPSLQTTASPRPTIPGLDCQPPLSLNDPSVPMQDLHRLRACFIWMPVSVCVVMIILFVRLSAYCSRYSCRGGLSAKTCKTPLTTGWPVHSPCGQRA